MSFYEEQERISEEKVNKLKKEVKEAVNNNESNSLKMVQLQKKSQKELLEWYGKQLPLWKKDPVLFAREVCGWNPVGEQREILRGLAKDDKLAVKAGRAVGKSVIASIAALWFITCYYNSLVLITSPNFQQLTDVIFGTVREIHRTSPLLMLLFESSAQQFKHRLMDATWKMVVKTATKGEGIRGYNRANKLYITDETTGIPDEILEALLGSTDEANSKMFMISNPTRKSGKFYDIYTDPTTYPEWRRYSMTRLITGFQIIYLSSPKAAEKAKKSWEHKIKILGKEHPEIRVEILGEFPLQDNKMAFPMELVSYVDKSDPFIGENKKEVESIVIGVDIAGEGGDLIVFTQNRLNYDYDNPRERTFTDPKEHFTILQAFGRANYNVSRDRLLTAIESVINEYVLLKGNKFKMLYVNIDSTGVGQPYFDYIRDEIEKSHKILMGHRIGKYVRIQRTTFNEKAEDTLNYVNRRAEMGEQFRHKMERNQEIVMSGKKAILYFDFTNGQFYRMVHREMSNIQKEFDNKSRVKYESKDKIRKRLKGVSTDTLDSFLLSSYIKKPRSLWFI